MKIKYVHIYAKMLDNMYIRCYSKTMQERYKGFQKILHRISNAIIKVIGTQKKKPIATIWMLVTSNAKGSW